MILCGITVSFRLSCISCIFHILYFFSLFVFFVLAVSFLLFCCFIVASSVGLCLSSGCVVECRICNRGVAGSNLGLGYFTPKSTQPSIPPGSVNEYQLQLERQRQVWLIPIADERVGVQVKL